MRAWLQTHPFAVRAFFERSLVVTFAFPTERVRALLPPYLSPDTWHDDWAFAAVAVVQTRALRPVGWPAALGTDFRLVGYRLFARYHTRGGKRLRGLYVLKSQTDRRRMTLLGNLFTHYGYETAPITLRATVDELAVAFADAEIVVDLPAADVPVPLPPDSPFADWHEARRFAGPLPFTFAYHAPARSVVVVEGVREFWQPAPVAVRHCCIPGLAALGLAGGVLASAFYVHDIPYRWQRGRLDPWPR